MKQLYSFIIFSLLLFSCEKEGNHYQPENYLSNVKAGLKDSLSDSDYAALDFSRAVLSEADSVHLYLLRVPIQNKLLRNDFVLVRTNGEGKILLGKIIHLEGSAKGTKWDGSISISSLNRKSVLNSSITNGYIDAWHATISAKVSSEAAPDVLPEIIVVAYINKGISYSDYAYLESMLYGPGGGGYNGSGSDGGNYYSSIGGGGTGGSGSSGGDPNSGLGDPNNGGVSQDAPILVNVEDYVTHPGIDITKYLKCFDAVPDNGATCKITIFADLPVDNDPTKLFNWNTQAVGHCFIQFNKTNGSQSVQQNVGFYPNSNYKDILNSDPVDSKIVDDAHHEFHASLQMTVSPEFFRLALDKAKEYAGYVYDMDENNCTDFALNVFNAARNYPLTIPKYVIPGGIAPSNTPNGLYVQLQNMVRNNDPEKGNISIGILKGWVGDSHGSCN